jgi:hypothetical protein
MCPLTGIGQEVVPWGPTDLTIDENSTFYIVDAANNRIQLYDAAGSHLSSIDLGNEVVGVTDLEVIGSDLLVLDAAATSPTVRHITVDGALVQTFTIPKEVDEKDIRDRISGIRVGLREELYVVLENGYSYLQLTAQKGIPLSTPRIREDFPGAEGKAYDVREADWSVNRHTGEIWVSDQMTGEIHRITIQVPHRLGGLRYLQTHHNGDFFVIVEEIYYNESIQVDQTVNHYDDSGNLLGTARVPLSDFYAPVEDSIAVGPDGNVYVLVPKQDRVEIQRLAFRPTLTSIFPDQERVATDVSTVSDLSSLSCRSRSTMVAVAVDYRTNYWYLSSENTDGYCNNRGKPRYIAGAGYYYSVPYDAGGWDTVNGYRNRMDSDEYQAGDYSWGDPCCAECSRGVDCSGFVTRVWGEDQKLYTWTIPQYSTELNSVDDLSQGDVLNDSSNHVALFYEFCSGGARVYHATTYGGFDRVIRRCHSWSYFNDYTPRKYDNVCQ